MSSTSDWFGIVLHSKSRLGFNNDMAHRSGQVRETREAREEILADLLISTSAFETFVLVFVFKPTRYFFCELSRNLSMFLRLIFFFSTMAIVILFQ